MLAVPDFRAPFHVLFRQKAVTELVADNAVSAPIGQTDEKLTALIQHCLLMS